jgi:hypothetical protein
MGLLEILNFVFSNVFGGLMTIWKNKQEDVRAEREFYLKTIIEQGNNTKDAREYEGVPVTEQNRIKTKKKKWVLWGKEFGYESSTNDSGNYRASTGFHITRRIIALVCVFAIVVMPMILPVWFDTSVAYGYIEKSWCMLPFVDGEPVIKWIVFGDGVKTIMVSPLQTNIVISIIGLFFSNQIVKKN